MSDHVPTCDPPCEDWPLCRHREPASSSWWDSPRFHLARITVVLVGCGITLWVTR